MKLQCSFAKNPPLGNPNPPPRVDFCSFWDFPALQFLVFHSNWCSAFFEKLQCSLLNKLQCSFPEAALQFFEYLAVQFYWNNLQCSCSGNCTAVFWKCRKAFVEKSCRAAFWEQLLCSLFGKTAVHFLEELQWQACPEWLTAHCGSLFARRPTFFHSRLLIQFVACKCWAML